MSETWRPVASRPAYEVSDRGRVRRIETGLILSVYTGDHYAKVRLKVGPAVTKNVHQLVAEAFLGPRPEGMEVCHNNGDAQDNRATNLRYDTHSNNQRDQVKHGIHAWANRTHCKHGHEYPEDTPRSQGGRSRRCIPCEKARTARRVMAGEFRRSA